MNFTNTKPTEPGAYWWRSDPCFNPTLVELDHKLFCSRLQKHLRDIRGEWSPRLVPEMTRERASKILRSYICENGNLAASNSYADWMVGLDTIVLDGRFTPDELESIAWWMRNTREK